MIFVSFSALGYVIAVCKMNIRFRLSLFSKCQIRLLCSQRFSRHVRYLLSPGRITPPAIAGSHIIRTVTGLPRTCSEIFAGKKAPADTNSFFTPADTADIHKSTANPSPPLSVRSELARCPAYCRIAGRACYCLSIWIY